MNSTSSKQYPFFDIAANLTDNQFQGDYYGKKYHESDVFDVIDRASSIGCNHLLIASGCLSDLIHSLQLCQQSPKFFTTGGIHPCRAEEPELLANPEEYWRLLDKNIQEGIAQKKLIAIGECGLDYDRLNYASKESQLKVFIPHFDLAEKYKLPLYLHNRNTGNDFFEIIEQNRQKFTSGIVHSFTGPMEEMLKIIQHDLFIGINGCSLKTQENLDVLKAIPLDKLMLETDAPYCEIRNSHASAKYVKTKIQAVKHEKFKQGFQVRSRNEPCNIIQVLEVVSAIKNIPEEELAKICYQNTLKFFNIPE